MNNWRIKGHEMIRLIENIKAVGFDLDATLYFQNKNDSFLSYLYDSIAQVLNRNAVDIETSFVLYRSKYENSLQTARALCFGHLSRDDVDELFLDVLEKHEEIDIMQYDNRLPKFMQDLSFQYQLFLVTGNREHHAARKLSALGVDPGLFHATCYGTENKLEGMRDISRRLGFLPAQMMYIGDQEKTDIACAADLGMITVKIGAEYDSQSRATFQARRVFDLREMLLGR